MRKRVSKRTQSNLCCCIDIIPRQRKVKMEMGMVIEYPDLCIIKINIIQDTPTTLPQSPSRLELSGLLASHGMNTLSPSTSAASLRSTPRQLLSTPRKNHRNSKYFSRNKI